MLFLNTPSNFVFLKIFNESKLFWCTFPSSESLFVLTLRILNKRLQKERRRERGDEGKMFYPQGSDAPKASLVTTVPHGYLTASYQPPIVNRPLNYPFRDSRRRRGRRRTRRGRRRRRGPSPLSSSSSCSASI